MAQPVCDNKVTSSHQGRNDTGVGQVTAAEEQGPRIPLQLGQPGSCCSGNFTDSTLIANLNVQIVDSDGSTVLATADSQPIGSSETTAQISLTAPGEYFVRVFEGNSPSQTQLYSLSVDGATLPPSSLPII